MSKYYSGIGKDWGRWEDPEDRGAWDYLSEEEDRRARDWVKGLFYRDRVDGMDERPGLPPPDPHVPYSSYEFGWSHEEELHRAYLHALQRVTEPDEWVHAIDDPQSVYWFRFWPHRGQVHARWHASPVANGDSQFFLARDFSWGILAFFEGRPSPPDCVFGQAMIDAFDTDPPPGWRASPKQ